MSELENIRSLEKYDAWKKAKQSRESWIDFISGLIGFGIGLLLTWAILRVGAGDVWNLGKGVFASEDKIMEVVPKIEEVDNNLKKSIVSKPMNWVSKKYEEQVAKEVSSGNLKAVVDGIRVYSAILIFAWFVVFGIIWAIISWLSDWIISKWFWKEPLLSSQRIDF
ncbi:MAG: hypothetical protein LBR43_00710 [Spiroplasmataceae bacterium]|nr:hypothetical protein [Spiroplasmataceae bacterium]